MHCCVFPLVLSEAAARVKDPLSINNQMLIRPILREGREDMAWIKVSAQQLQTCNDIASLSTMQCLPVHHDESSDDIND
jgi:hypothetical protein